VVIYVIMFSFVCNSQLTRLQGWVACIIWLRFRGQEIGWEYRLWNDLCCVERDVQPYSSRARGDVRLCGVIVYVT